MNKVQTKCANINEKNSLMMLSWLSKAILHTHPIKHLESLH